MPAIEAGIAEQNKEIDDIVNNPEAPTFENTIQALTLSGSTLNRVVGVLFNISETDRTDELDSIMEMAMPLMTEHSDNINFNKGLYNRVAALYQGDQSQLTREQQMSLKKVYEGFVRNGVGLDSVQQARLKEINAELAYQQNQS